MKTKFIERACNIRAFQVKFNGLYREYKWKPGIVASNVRARILTPVEEFTPDKTEKNEIMCAICYNYYPLINQTQCCFNHICTECIAAIIDPPPNQAVCPFCRKGNFYVTANLSHIDLKKHDNDDKEYQKYEKKIRDGFDADDFVGCRDESIAIALQYNANPRIINDLVDAGVSIDVVIDTLKNPPLPIIEVIY